MRTRQCPQRARRWQRPSKWWVARARLRCCYARPIHSSAERTLRLWLKAALLPIPLQGSTVFLKRKKRQRNVASVQVRTHVPLRSGLPGLHTMRPLLCAGRRDAVATSPLGLFLDHCGLHMRGAMFGGGNAPAWWFLDTESTDCSLFTPTAQTHTATSAMPTCHCAQRAVVVSVPVWPNTWYHVKLEGSSDVMRSRRSQLMLTWDTSREAARKRRKRRRQPQQEPLPATRRQPPRGATRRAHPRQADEAEPPSPAHPRDKIPKKPRRRKPRHRHAAAVAAPRAAPRPGGASTAAGSARVVSDLVRRKRRRFTVYRADSR